jgi:N-acetylglucosaminyl-diphospho-decaprenol L-rhamnosyltransferase
MLLSVIIVSYNVKDYLWQCLYSLEKALKGLDAEVIVFDNHSRDGSVDALAKAYPTVTFISSPHNIGFARGNNHAIRQSSGEYVLLLNPDTLVGEDTIRHALSFMAGHLGAGALGTRMLNSDGSVARESRRGIPAPMTAFYKMSGLCRLFPTHRKLGRYYMGWLSWDEPARIEIISGAYCLLRRQALEEVGLLDEDFFMYGEDIDLSFRLLKAGWENWYLPDAILHYKGESTQKSSFRYVHVFYEAMLIFFRKHYSHLSVLITLPVSLAIYAKATLSLLSTTMKKTRRSLGFVSKDKETDPLYIFYIAPQHMAQCQRLAKHKGLWAEFHDANKRIRENPTLTGRQTTTFLTYDASAYSFNEMFERISRLQDNRVALAVYYPDKDMVITAADIIK